MRSADFDKTLHHEVAALVADANGSRANAGVVNIFNEGGVRCDVLASAVIISNSGTMPDQKTAEPLIYTYQGWKGLARSIASGGEQQGPPADLAKRWEIIEQMPKGLWRVALAATEATIGSLYITNETVKAATTSKDGLIRAFGDMAVPTIALPLSIILKQCSDTPGNYGLRAATTTFSDQTRRIVTLTPRALTEKTPENLRPTLYSHLLRLAILGRNGAVPFEISVYDGPVPDDLKDSITTLYEYSDNGPSSINSTTGDNSRSYDWEGPQFNSDKHSPPGSNPSLADTVKQVHAHAFTLDETIDYLKEGLRQCT